MLEKPYGVPVPLRKEHVPASAVDVPQPPSSVPPVPVAAPCSEEHPFKNPFTKLHGYSEVETEKRTNSQKLPLK
jgi:hypothetical protein